MDSFQQDLDLLRLCGPIDHHDCRLVGALAARTAKGATGGEKGRRPDGAVDGDAEV
jgi:hypothetical protein